MAANEATGDPSLSKSTPPAPANPANWDQTEMANQPVVNNCQPYRQHHGSQKKSSKADGLLANAHDAELRTTRRASTLNSHEETTHCNSRSTHWLQTGTGDTKSNDRSPSIIHSQRTGEPLSASCLMGDFRRGGIGFRKVGNADFDGDDGQHITASDRIEGKGVVEIPNALM